MQKWDIEKHSVGVEIIDEQHKFLFSIISEIYDTIIQNDSKAMKLIIMKLIFHSNEHFKTEIEYLLKNGANIEDITQHMVEHYDIITILFEKAERCFIYDENIMIDVALYVNNYISNHIIEYDIEIFKKLNIK